MEERPEDTPQDEFAVKERPSELLEGEYVVDVSKPSGEVEHLVISIRRLPSALPGLDLPQVERLLQQLAVQPEHLEFRAGAEADSEPEVDVSDVMALLDSADETLRESSSYGQATREDLNAIRKEIDRLSH